MPHSLQGLRSRIRRKTSLVARCVNNEESKHTTEAAFERHRLLLSKVRKKDQIVSERRSESEDERAKQPPSGGSDACFRLKDVGREGRRAKWPILAMIDGMGWPLGLTRPGQLGDGDNNMMNSNSEQS